MTDLLRVLLVEDSEDDALLVLRALRRGSREIEWTRVDNVAALRDAMQSKVWDIVLSDYYMPNFNGLAALLYLRENGYDTPFILVSGKIGEETAAEVMKAGAQAVLSKDNLIHLLPTVDRELAEAEQQRRRLEEERDLAATHERYGAMFQGSEISLWDVDLSAISAELQRLRAGGVADLGAYLDEHPERLPGLLEQLRVADVNMATVLMFGAVSKEQFLQTFRQLFADEASAALRELLLAMWSGQQRITMETVLHALDGRPLDVIVTLPVPSVPEGAGDVPVSVVNITERKRAEREVAELAERNRLILESAGEGIFGLDLEGRHTFVNPAALRLLGFGEEELVGRRSHNLWHKHRPDHSDYPETECPIYAVLRDGQPRSGEEYFNRHDGTLFPVEFVCTPMHSDGVRIGAVATFRDITERKQAQQALLRSNRALRAISASNHALIHARDEQALLREVCRIVVEIGGYRMAWVGRVVPGAVATLEPLATAGYVDNYFEQQPFVLGEERSRWGAAGWAIRTKAVVTMDDLASDERFAAMAEKALQRDYRSALAFPLLNDGEPFGALTIYSSETHAFTVEEVRIFGELADDTAFGVSALHMRQERDAARSRMMESLEQIGITMRQTIQALATAVEKRDPFTAGHQQRVAQLCDALGREMGLPEHEVAGIELSALIHDVGKIYIPAEILSRPGRLTETEYSLVKYHPEMGRDIVSGVDFPWPVSETILAHHERMDGSGYPRGLQGEAIPLGARIIAVADVVEAMSSHRPYRPAIGIDAALAEIEQGRGRLYDATVVDACLRLFRDKGFSLPASE